MFNTHFKTQFNSHFPGFEHFGREFRHGGPFGGGGPGPFGGGGGGPFGERRRQRRGDVKFVLLELVNEQPRHGYELIKALEERSAGFYRPSPGLVYPTLQLLEDEGSVTSQMTDDKRIYTITEAGKRILNERAEGQPDQHEGGKRPKGEKGDRGGRGGPWQDGPKGGNMGHLHELRRSAMALSESVMQAARYGTPEQAEAVQALLIKANQDVHAILAQDSASTSDAPGKITKV